MGRSKIFECLMLVRSGLLGYWLMLYVLCNFSVLQQCALADAFFYLFEKEKFMPELVGELELPISIGGKEIKQLAPARHGLGPKGRRCNHRLAQTQELV